MEWFNPFEGGGSGGGTGDAYTKIETNELLNQKVDKESGKGLSTEDYTTEDKMKIDNLGTAAERDVPASGNAGNTEVVMGNDTRLTDARPASDVSDWAKALTKPAYSYSEITNTPTVDAAPSSDSNNLVSSGGVYTALDDKVDKVQGKGLSTEDYTTAEKTKLGGIETEANKTIVDRALSDSSTNPVQNKAVKSALNDKVDKVTGKGLSTEDYTTAEKTKLAELTNDYTNHTNKPSINNVTLSGNKTSLDLGLLPSSTKYGASISVTINDLTYVVTAILKDQDGNTLGTAQTIDLPLESMVIGGEYDDTTKKIILTLKNEQTVEFSVADLVAGLQTEITSSNKLSADLVDDTNAVNKFMMAAEKTKLSGIETGANKTIVDSALSDNSINPVQNQAITTALATKENSADHVILPKSDFDNLATKTAKLYYVYSDTAINSLQSVSPNMLQGFQSLSSNSINEPETEVLTDDGEEVSVDDSSESER